MNKSIRKAVKASRKPYIQLFVFKYDETSGLHHLYDLATEFGLNVYEDPSSRGDSDEGYIVSSKTLTYGWLMENAKRFGLNKKWLEETFWDERNEELEEANP